MAQPILVRALRFLLALALASTAATDARAQLLPLPRTVAPDPYTAGRDGALERAGYVSLGPLPISAHHTTDDLRILLPDEPLRWIETAHFRIGCALGAAEVGGSPAFVARLRGELADLAARLPDVTPKTKILDSWLRAHLVALRVERIYAAALSTVGCEQAWFERASVAAAPGAPFAGLGPHFGMREKFTVLLFASTASLQRYTAAYHGAATSSAARRHDGAFGNMVFAAAADGGQAIGSDEEALAATLAYHVAHNLYVGCRSFGHLLPAWLPEGLALRHARQVSERVAVVDVRGDADRAAYQQWGRRLADARKAWPFGPVAALAQHIDGGTLTLDESFQAYALVDWLVRERREAFARFALRLKDPFHDRMRFPTVDELMARQDEAMRAAFGGGAETLEAQWKGSFASKKRR